MGMREKPKGGLSISIKTFVSAVVILLAIMIAAGILTRVLPMSTYGRTINADGNIVINPDDYTVTDGSERLPIWRWFTAPFDVLFNNPDTGSVLQAVVIIAFIVLIGGTFSVLEKAGIFNYFIAVTIKRFGQRKYLLMGIIAFISMLLGSTMGLLEETVPLVPLIVSLALALGWDTLVGLGMSILAVGFGFASGTFNPFTVVVAQRLAGVEVYSGLWLRAVVFAVVYAVLMVFLYTYAKRIERDPMKSLVYETDIERKKRFVYDPNDPILSDRSAKRATLVFATALALLAAYIVASLLIDGLSDYTMPVMAVLLTAGGLIAGAISGYAARQEREAGMIRDFGSGCLSILPCMLLIVMAMSVKYIIETGGVMDTVLHGAYTMMNGVSPVAAALMVYLFVLILEFFMSGAASKAFLIIPIVAPLADLIGLTRQSIVLAFCFGDGSNVFFPTCALLIVVLGLVDVPYGKWLRFTWKPQLLLLLITSAVLMLAVVIGYA